MDNLLFKVPRVEPVSLVLRGSEKKYFFPNLEVFNQGILVGASTYRAADVPRDPSGAALLTDALLEAAFLTLYGNDNQIIRQSVPLTEFVRPDQNGVFYTVVPTAVNWQKSFIEFEPNASITPGLAAFFNLYYYRTEDVNAPGAPGFGQWIGGNIR